MESIERKIEICCTEGDLTEVTNHITGSSKKKTDKQIFIRRRNGMDYIWWFSILYVFCSKNIGGYVGARCFSVGQKCYVPKPFIEKIKKCTVICKKYTVTSKKDVSNL